MHSRSNSIAFDTTIVDTPRDTEEEEEEVRVRRHSRDTVDHTKGGKRGCHTECNITVEIRDITKTKRLDTAQIASAQHTWVFKDCRTAC